MSQTRDFSSFVRIRGDGTAEMDLAVEGVTCGGCMRRIETGLQSLEGILEARMNFTDRRLAVRWSAQRQDAGTIVDAVGRLGYTAHPFVVRRAEDGEAEEAKRLLRALGVAGFAAMNIMLLSVSVWAGNASDITPETRDFFHWVSALIALPASAYAGQPFFRSAFAALRRKTTNMDVPISIGVVLALGLSLYETITHGAHAYFESPVMLLFFLLCGRYLDHAMRVKTRSAAASLAALRADTAHRLDAADRLVEVPAAALRVGDRILVRPGDRVAADGIVASGLSEIDESLVTGETALRAVKPGDAIHAGTRNFTGALTVRVTAAKDHTLLDEVERLLRKAQEGRTLGVPIADRAARLYAPVVHSAAALTFLGWIALGAGAHEALFVAISVLIITCPCALALAAPVVQVIAAGRLFRSGVLLNSGDALERLARTNTVVFDKTGTLTLPEARVVNASRVPADLMQIASRLALSSHHALAAAVAREGGTRVPYEGVVEHPGEGIRVVVDGQEARLGSFAFCEVQPLPAGAGSTSAIAFRHGERTAVFEVRQQLRPDAAAVVRGLQASGLDVRIFSGDRPQAVEPVARTLGVSDWRAAMKPADKIAALEELKQAGRHVLMVGDGLNDAPALAAAQVSLSPITAAELSQAQADAVFLGTRLGPVAEALVTARLARRLTVENLAFAALYNAFAVPIAMLGWVTPLVAAAAMSASSVAVVVNALRLNRRKPPAQTKAETAAALPGAHWSVS